VPKEFHHSGYLHLAVFERQAAAQDKVVRMLLAVAANESSTKSRRVKRKMLENAEAGLPHGGYHRPFGSDDDDKVTMRPEEAQVIRAWPSGSWPARACGRWRRGWTSRASTRSAASRGVPRPCGRCWRRAGSQAYVTIRGR
jgi:DNA invertase Pin-like site-specific DNA recombinase